MSNPFIGQIVLFAGNFAPQGWMLCQGQTLAIASNAALFSILGTTYGGNGVSTFALPDLRGRVAVNQGQGPGLSSYVLGEQTGVETVTLTVPEMPIHAHGVVAKLTADASGGSTTAVANANLAQVVSLPGRPPTLLDSFTSGAPANPAALAGLAVTVQTMGGGGSHTNVQPLLALNYIIAIQGIFPSRN